MKSPVDPLTWLRSICAALAGVEEVVAWAHPNFRVSGRTFATFEIVQGRPSIAIKAELDAQEMLIERFGLFKTPYSGKHGWVSVWVDGNVDWDLIEGLVVAAHAMSSARPEKKSSPRAKPRKIPVKPKPGASS